MGCSSQSCVAPIGRWLFMQVAYKPVGLRQRPPNHNAARV